MWKHKGHACILVIEALNGAGVGADDGHLRRRVGAMVKQWPVQSASRILDVLLPLHRPS